MDRDNPVLPRRSLYPALEVFLSKIRFHIQVCGDPEARIAHDEEHFHGFVVLVVPQSFQVGAGERFAMLVIIGFINLYKFGVILVR